MVEELNRTFLKSKIEDEEKNDNEQGKQYNDRKAEEREFNCANINTQCVLSHICYQYSSMVMAGLIEALDYFAGKQGPKVLIRILAKNIPIHMMNALGIQVEDMKNIDEEELINMLPAAIASKGGPNIEIEKNNDGEYRFTLHECHFLPYSKSKGFCNVTAGLMLGFAQFLSKKPMDIEEIQTIAHGGEKCEFIARPRKV